MIVILVAIAPARGGPGAPVGPGPLREPVLTVTFFLWGHVRKKNFEKYFLTVKINFKY